MSDPADRAIMAGFGEDGTSSGSEGELVLPQRTHISMEIPLERIGHSSKKCTMCSSGRFGSQKDLKRHIGDVHMIRVPRRSGPETRRQRMRKGVHKKLPPNRSRKVEDWFEQIPHRPRKTSTCGGGGGGSYRPSSPTVSNASADTDELMERDDEAIQLRAELERTRNDRVEFSRRLAELEDKMQRVRNEIVHLQTEPHRGGSKVESTVRKSRA